MNKQRMMDIAMAAFTIANDPDQKVVNAKEETNDYSPVELATFGMIRELFSSIPESNGVDIMARYVDSLNRVSS